MKTKEIAKTYGVDGDAFDRWLEHSGYAYKSGLLGGLDLADGQNIDEIVLAYKQHRVQEKERIAREASDRQRAAALKQEAMDSMLVTTGFDFEGYTITKYAGYVSGDDVVEFERTSGLFGRSTVGPGLMASMADIRRGALDRLKEAAVALGCNAVIGVDFHYLTVDPKHASLGGNSTTYRPYVFGVTANGTAVVIEPAAQVTAR